MILEDATESASFAFLGRDFQNVAAKRAKAKDTSGRSVPEDLRLPSRDLSARSNKLGKLVKSSV